MATLSLRYCLSGRGSAGIGAAKRALRRDQALVAKDLERRCGGERKSA